MMGQGEEWLERSRQSFQAGRYEAALREVAEALRLEPQVADAWNLQGAVLKRLGRSPEALNNYDRALTLDPRSVKAWFNKGLLLEELQRYQEAIECYQNVVKLEPNFAGMDDRLDVLQRQNLTISRTLKTSTTSQASDDVENGISKDAENWLERGDQQFMAGDFQGMIASYDKALEIKLDYLEAWIGRGCTLFFLGRKEATIASLDKALEIKPNYPPTLFCRGIALSDLGREEEAIESYDKALKSRPDYYDGWIYRANAVCSLSRIKPLSPNLISLAQPPDFSQHNDHPHITSLLQGQPHINPDTEGWGIFHLALGDAYYNHARGQQDPRRYWRKANHAYQVALPTVENHLAESHLKILYGLMRTSLALGYTADANAYRETALQVFGDLLNAAPTIQKRQLEIQFSGLSYIAAIPNSERFCAISAISRNIKNHKPQLL